MNEIEITPAGARAGYEPPVGDGAAAEDPDPEETREWLESFDAVLQRAGRQRSRYLMGRLFRHARMRRSVPDEPLTTDFVNTIPPEEEPPVPGDEQVEWRIRRIIRWNAAVMVHRANKRFPGLGGHLASYASTASLYEVGFNHFFRGRDGGAAGDQIFFQGHAAPGIYARAFLEGRVSEAQMEHFRREAQGTGLSSYPHPRLMPDFWELPTVSMGLGPIAAIYQARFNRYLQARGVADTSGSRVWAFVGDGETDEPEALGSLSIAAREGLDNLTFVVNCNLQRLDGPVRGNGKIIQELEAVFRGAGWNVIKVIWSRRWDPLLARDTHGLLVKRMNEVCDGDFQKYATEPGSYTRSHFFGADPRLLELVADLSDADIRRLRRGGHDMRKIYAAYKAAVEHRGRPTVILAHTVKGWALGEGFEARNVTHQMKKLDLEELRAFRDRLELPIPDDKLEDAPYFHPGPDSPEARYVQERRRALGGFVPRRRVSIQAPLVLPGDELYAELFAGQSGERGRPRSDGGAERPNAKAGGGVSTTMAFVRLLAKLLAHKGIGKRIVPIIPDEARTFGMDALFRQVGIYSSVGQLYEPVDKAMLLYYRETKDGQLLEEGITEAGSVASFTAAATAYAAHSQQMIPFYMFYSMFGFQRTGDQLWALGDARGRGFLMGCTAGRTTLNGEGLQHQDGHSQILASTVPSVVAYDPAFAYEIALIVQEGLRRMVGQGDDVTYYITLQNENYPMPPMPPGSREGVLRGLYLYRAAASRDRLSVELFGSGSILNEVLRAQQILADLGVMADVWSVPSYLELRRDALACERHDRLHPGGPEREPWIARALAGRSGPFVAASDWMKIVPEQIARWIPGRYVVLGTDGFGMSDTREDLRRHFEVDAESIAIAAMDALRRDGKIPVERVDEAIRKLGYDRDKPDPSER
ncbi:MAG: pyruvate dehydrogenase (acetyl-transferring), homodimeric type [Deltaproteobacteria bacterium]|nr:pyruvate dehydrogenase (acetyl-transferring), homodimeric type [Deltaproteobacteria bacterium]